MPSKKAMEIAEGANEMPRGWVEPERRWRFVRDSQIALATLIDQGVAPLVEAAVGVMPVFIATGHPQGWPLEQALEGWEVPQ